MMPMSRSREQMSISVTSADRKLIESAATAVGMTVAEWVIHTVREEARWAVARQVTAELSAEAGVTDEHRAWAASVLGVTIDE